MLSAHSRSVGSGDRRVSAMVLYELAELALHIRRFASNNDDITNAGPKTACSTWIALISVRLGERRRSAKGNDLVAVPLQRPICRGC